MMTEILVLQNSLNEGPSKLGILFKNDGFSITTVYAKKEAIPRKKFSAVVILGAPESANDDYDYLRNEINYIKASAKNETPILGICLGSQLIAKAMGGRIYQGFKKEIGFFDDIEFENQSKSNLFSGIKSPATVFHWHGDTFDLPQRAIRLAHSTNYQNQAFTIGPAVGVQFHLEVDEQTIRTWLQKSKKELEGANIDPEIILRRLHESIYEIEKNLKVFYGNFKAEFGL